MSVGRRSITELPVATAVVELSSIIDTLKAKRAALDAKSEGQVISHAIAATILVLEQAQETYRASRPFIGFMAEPTAKNALVALTHTAKNALLATLTHTPNLTDEKEKLKDAIRVLNFYITRLQKDAAVLPAELTDSLKLIQQITQGVLPDYLKTIETSLDSSDKKASESNETERKRSDSGDTPIDFIQQLVGDKSVSADIAAQREGTFYFFKNELKKIHAQLKDALSKAHITPDEKGQFNEKITPPLNLLAIAANAIHQFDELNLSDFLRYDYQKLFNAIMALNSDDFIKLLPNYKETFEKFKVPLRALYKKLEYIERFFGIQVLNSKLNSSIKKILGEDWEYAEKKAAHEKDEITVTHIQEALSIVEKYKQGNDRLELSDIYKLMRGLENFYHIECVKYGIKLEKIFNQYIGLNALKNDIASLENRKTLLEFDIFMLENKISTEVKDTKDPNLENLMGKIAEKKSKIAELDKQIKPIKEEGEKLLEKIENEKKSNLFKVPFYYDPDLTRPEHLRSRSIIQKEKPIDLSKTFFDNFPKKILENEVEKIRLRQQEFSRVVPPKNDVSDAKRSGVDKQERSATPSPPQLTRTLSHREPIRELNAELKDELSYFIRSNRSSFDEKSQALFDQRNLAGMYTIDNKSDHSLAVNVLRLSSNILNRLNILERTQAAFVAAKSLGKAAFASFMLEYGKPFYDNYNLIRSEWDQLNRHLEELRNLPYLSDNQRRLLKDMAGIMGKLFKELPGPLQNLQATFLQVQATVGMVSRQVDLVSAANPELKSILDVSKNEFKGVDNFVSSFEEKLSPRKPSDILENQIEKVITNFADELLDEKTPDEKKEIGGRVKSSYLAFQILVSDITDIQVKTGIPTDEEATRLIHQYQRAFEMLAAKSGIKLENSIDQFKFGKSLPTMKFEKDELIKLVQDTAEKEKCDTDSDMLKLITELERADSADRIFTLKGLFKKLISNIPEDEKTHKDDYNKILERYGSEHNDTAGLLEQLRARSKPNTDVEDRNKKKFLSEYIESAKRNPIVGKLFKSVKPKSLSKAHFLIYALAKHLKTQPNLNKQALTQVDRLMTAGAAPRGGRRG